MARSVGLGAESGASGPWEETESTRPASSQPSLRSGADHPSHVQARPPTPGVNGASTHFLRGHQKCNADGIARFDTIYPGWYRGRTPHIHVTNAEDSIYRDGGEGTALRVRRRSGGGYRATLALGVS
jgi:hypothetical protein